MLKAHWKKHTLEFKRPSGTSRGVLKKKSSWFIHLTDGISEKGAIGECGLLRGLSVDPWDSYEEKLQEVCDRINEYESIDLTAYPSIQFGLEMAMKDWKTGANRILFPSDFTKKETAIPINGLIWMGEKAFMFQQIKDKLSAGFDCVKLKIGGIDFEDEIDLLKYIRKQFPKEDIELRVDANGAFKPKDALEKLKRLSELDLHSIEQPIRQGQLEEMARLCQATPLAIALDEELIGIHGKVNKANLIDTIKPQYIILKPSLVGGFKSSEEWIQVADKHDINWWITSALEANIGLSAISQWTYTLNNPMHQGLGTGQLYTNNIPSPLEVEKGGIYYRKNGNWDYSYLD